MKRCASCGSTDRWRAFRLGGFCCSICVRLADEVLLAAREEWARILMSEATLKGERR